MGMRMRWLAVGLASLLAVAALAAEWPQARGGFARTGAVAGEAGPARGTLVWQWQHGDEGFLSTAAVADGRIYVASATMGALAESGTIYCFNAATGEKLWSSAPAGYRPTYSSPVIAGDYLVCGEGLHLTDDARIVCLDLKDQGKVLWTFRTGNHVECTPVVYENKVYVGAGDDGYYCLDLRPGIDEQRRVIWHVPGPKSKDAAGAPFIALDAETALTVYEGKVYAGLGMGGKALAIFDANTGKLLQKLDMPYPVFAPPTLVDGKLYLGMGNGDFIKEGKGGEVRCIDLKTLQTDWTFPLPQTVLGAMPFVGDRLYVGCRDGILYCLDRSGKEQGRFDTRSAIVTAPAVTDGHVYVMTDAGMLYGLDRATLQPVMEFMVGTDPLFISSPVVAGGHVYVGSQLDGFLCIGEPVQGKAVPVWAGSLGGPGVGGNLDDSPIAKLGAFQWQYPGDQTGETTKAFLQAPIAAIEKDLYLPLADGPTLGLACLPADATAQEAPAPRWVYKTANPVVLSPVVIGDAVFIVDGKPGDKGRKLHCLDRATGTARWTKPVEDGATGDLGAAEPNVAGPQTHIICVQDKVQGPTTALDLMGKQFDGDQSMTMHMAFTAKGDGDHVSGPIATSDLKSAYVTDRGELVIVDLKADPETVARIPGALPGFAPLVSRNTVLFLAEGQIMRVDLDKPTAKPTQWVDTSWLGKPTTSMVLRNGNVYLGMAGWGLARFGKSR